MHARTLVSAALLALALVPAASAQQGLRDENFVTLLPHGFKIGLNKSRPGLAMQEMIPQAETVEAWSEMVTIQILLGQRSRPAAPFLQNMGALWAKACPRMSHGPIVNGATNGYASATLLMTCSRDPITAKPETTLFLAVSGADSFYLAQYAFGRVASAADLARAAAYLKTVTACDTRTQEHSCAHAFPSAPPR